MKSNRWLSVLALSAVLGLAGCGGDDNGGSTDGDETDKTEATASPTVESVLACLTEAGIEAEDVSADDDVRLEIRYPNDTTKIDFLSSPEEAEENVEFGKSYDFDDFSVGSIYVLIGDLDEDALEDSDAIKGCL